MRDGADPAGRDLLVSERRAARAVRVPGGGVVNGGCGGAQVSGAEWQSRDGGQVAVSRNVPAALVVAEEEQLVLDDAASERPAKLIVNRVRDAAGKNVPGLQVAVAMILEGAAVQIVAAGFECDIRHGSAGAP